MPDSKHKEPARSPSEENVLSSEELRDLRRQRNPTQPRQVVEALERPGAPDIALGRGGADHVAHVIEDRRIARTRKPKAT